MKVILPYITFYYINVTRQYVGFAEIFADEGDNPVNKQKIYNVEGDNRLLP